MCAKRVLNGRPGRQSASLQRVMRSDELVMVFVIGAVLLTSNSLGVLVKQSRDWHTSEQATV